MDSRLLHTVIDSRAVVNKPVLTAFLAVVAVFLLVTTGCVREGDITLEQRAHQLSGELMCPVCDGQTIDGSNAQIAQDMRVKVRDLLQAGDSNAEIRDYFVLRYGEEILASPEGQGFNLLAWLVPVVIVLVGVVIALLTIKNLQRSGVRQAAEAAAAANKSGEGDLSDYLAQIDRDLGIHDASPTQAEKLKQAESSPEVDS